MGGETTSLPTGAPAMISIAGRGTVAKGHLVTRAGGTPGDALFVTGFLGGSIRGKHLDFYPRLVESAWLVENFNLSAMMDLSDGLAKDLPRLARASGCGFRLMEALIPCSEGCSLREALGDGEDYELLFSCRESGGLLEQWAEQFPELPLTRIGALAGEGTGSLMGGWDHFDR